MGNYINAMDYVIEYDLDNRFKDVPDRFKTQEMCIDAVDRNVLMFEYVPNHLKTQEMCMDAVTRNELMFEDVPDHLKTREMCDYAVNT